MNLNPTSPLSGKPLSECDDREVELWIWWRMGAGGYSLNALKRNSGAGPRWTQNDPPALSLMETDEWPEWYSLEYQHANRTAFVTDMRTDDDVVRASTPAAAIARAWLVAVENKEEKP